MSEIILKCLHIPKIYCTFALRNNLCATKIVKIFEVAIKLLKNIKYGI